MASPAEQPLDACLLHLMNQLHHLRLCNLADEEGLESALDESLEVLRGLSLYRALLKNIGERQAAVSLPACGMH